MRNNETKLNEERHQTTALEQPSSLLLNTEV